MTATARKSFKALGTLLLYPEEEWLGALDEITGCLAAEQVLGAEAMQGITELRNYLQSTDIYTVQERYISLFDRSRTLSLHLYEHVHGESRDRGMAMVNLSELYQRHGFGIDASELPDYLPMLCEFLSQIAENEARAILAEAATVLEVLRQRLDKRESPYAAVLAALVSLGCAKVDRRAVAAVLAADSADDSDDLEALDRVWEEAEVRFGPGAAMEDCGMPRRPGSAPPAMPASVPAAL